MRSERQQGPAGKGLVGHFKDFGAFFFLMSIFERERDSGGGAGREGDRIRRRRQALSCQRSARREARTREP